eukprot:11215518-Lingulodinium_polyedra.AAC.1
MAREGSWRRGFCRRYAASPRPGARAISSRPGRRFCARAFCMWFNLLAERDVVERGSQQPRQ